MWIDLKERFSHSNAPRIYQIKRAIWTHVQDQSSLSIYFKKWKSLWDELTSYNNLLDCSCGALKTLTDYQQQERFFQFLMGLNDSYSAIRSQILAMDPLPTMNKAYATLLQEEKRHGLHILVPNQTDIMALVVSKGDPRIDHTQNTSIESKNAYIFIVNIAKELVLLRYDSINYIVFLLSKAHLIKELLPLYHLRLPKQTRNQEMHFY